MAEEQDPFAAFGTDESPTEPMKSKVEPLTPAKRFYLQNFFDTNDTARKKYLKQLGYYMNPNDDNLIRAIGTSGPWVPIDPGFGDAYKKGGFMGVGKEFVQDLGDITYDAADIGQKAIAALGSGATGAIGGAAAGSPGGAPGIVAGALATGIPAAVAGAAASGALSNSAKQGIRNLLLDESMDFDAKEMALDATLSAAGASLFGGAAKGFRAIKDFDIATRVNGIKNALKAAGNVADPNLIERAAREPELFTEKAVEGGTDRLAAAQKQIFGLDADEFITEAKDLRRARPDSYFGKLLGPLFEQQDRLYEEMAASPRANVSYFDAKRKLGDLYSSLERVVLRGNATKEQEEAFDVARGQLNALRKMAEDKVYSYLPDKISSKVNEKIPESSLKDVQFSFKEAREFLDRFQSRAFDKEKRTQNKLINEAAGGIRSFLDDVARKSGVEKNGVNLGQLVPEINAKMSSILEDYKTAKEKLLNTGNIVQAYVGGTTPQSRIKGAEIENFMKRLDRDYQTNLAEDFKLETAQALFESIYKGTPAKGSSRVNPFMIGEAAKSAMKYATPAAAAGGITGVGALPGFLGGATYGAIKGAKEAAALAQPEVGLRKLGDLLQEQAARNAQDPIQTAIKDSLAAGAGAGAISQAVQVQGNEPEEIDPFAEFGK